MLKLFRIAIRNLTRNRRRTLLSLSAIVLGIAAMIFFRGFMLGWRAMMIDATVNGTTGALQIHRTGYLEDMQALPLRLDLEDTPALREKIRAVEGVAALSPRIVFGAMFSTPDSPAKDGAPEVLGKTTFLMLNGVDPSLERVVAPRLSEWVKNGRFFKESQAKELVLSEGLVANLGLEVLAETSRRPTEDQWPAVLAADRDGALNGVGVVLTGAMQNALPSDKRMGYLPLSTAQTLLRMEGRVTEYGIQVKDLSRLDEVRDALALALGPDYEVHTWRQLLPFVQDIYQTQDGLLAILTGIVLLVVLLGILNAMLMSVLERVREIGTMMAVGVRRTQLVWLFVMEGGALGVLGGTLGMLAGGALVSWTRHRGITLHFPGTSVASVIRPALEPSFALATWLVASLGAAFGSLWPALRASRMRPVEALSTP
jgi:putative ABC transport system permease protein